MSEVSTLDAANSAQDAEEATMKKKETVRRSVSRTTAPIGQNSPKFKALFEHTNDAILIADDGGHYVDANPAACALFGMGREMLLGKSVADFVRPELAENVKTAWERFVIEGGAEGEYELLRPDGTMRYLNFKATANILPGMHLSIVRDATEQKLSLKLIRESERFAHAAIDALSAHISILDQEGFIIHVNRVWEDFALEQSGSLADKAIGANYLGVCDDVEGEDGEEGPVVAQGIRDVISGSREEFTIEYPCHSPSEQRWFVCRVTKFKGTGPVRVVVAHENITERKLAEDQRRKSEERYRGLIENISEVFYVADGAGTITYASPNLSESTGYDVHEVLGRSYVRFVHPDDRRRAVEFYAEAARGDAIDVKIELRAVRKNGSVFWVEQSTRIIKDKQGKVLEYRNVVQDVSDRRSAYEKLEQERTLLRTIIEAIPDEIGVKDDQRRFILANKACVRALKQSTEEGLLGRKDEDLIKSIYADIGRMEDESVLTKAKPMISKVGTTGIAPDGSVGRCLLTTKIPLLDQGSRAIGLVVINRDISELRETEVKLRNRNEQLGNIFENLDQVFWSFDTVKQQYTDISPTFERIYGVAPRELLVNPALWLELVHPEDRNAAMDFGGVESGTPVMQVMRIIRRNDGAVRWVQNRIRGVVENGKLVRMDGVLTDITEQKLAELAVMESEAKYRQLFDEAPVGFHEIDSEGRIVRINQTELSMLGYQRDEVIGRFLWELILNPEAKADILAKLKGSMPIQSVERTAIRKNGEHFPVLIEHGYVIDEAGKIVGMRGSWQDMTARTRARAALVESERRFRALIENNSDLIVLVDESGKVKYASPANERILGFTEAEVVGKSGFEFIHPEDLAAVSSMFEHLRAVPNEVATAQFRSRHKSGGWRWLECTGKNMLDDPSIQAIITNSHDITNRREAQKALEQSEEKYREFFEEDLSGAFISSVDGKMLACNQQYAHIFGYDSIEEVLATPASQFCAESGDRERFLALVKENKKLENYEEDARKKDGRLIHLIENIIGKFDEQGELVEIRGYVMDITQRRLLEEHLRQAQKMESVGTLAGGIAHDFNNILGIIMGYTSIIERIPGLPPGVEPSLETINKAVHRGAGVVRQLLTFARKGDVSVESIDVNHVVEELTGMLRETFPRSINLSVHLTDHKLRILADHTQLVQAMLNLCVNARDAMPNGGTLAIVTDLRSGNLLKRTNRGAVSGPYAYVAVTDTGHGMSEEVRKRIFEPFFTTKATGKGTGLGMAVVYGIVNAYNGFIEIESVEGRGTTFHMYFPLQGADHIVVESGVGEVGELPGGTETILVVEDEDVMADLLENILSSRGYTVLVARDGEAGVKMFREHIDSIDIVLSDLGLPKLGGFEAFKEMKRMKPQLKVIFASGYLAAATREEMKKEGGNHFIQKPYVVTDLLQQLRQLLDAPEPMEKAVKVAEVVHA